MQIAKIDRTDPNNKMALMGVKDVARITGLSTTKVFAAVSSKEVPAHRAPGGRKLIFLRTDIMTWIASSRRRTF